MLPGPSELIRRDELLNRSDHTVGNRIPDRKYRDPDRLTASVGSPQRDEVRAFDVSSDHCPHHWAGSKAERIPFPVLMEQDPVETAVTRQGWVPREFPCGSVPSDNSAAPINQVSGNR